MIKLPKNPDRVQKKEFRKLMTTPGTKFNYMGMKWGTSPAVFEVHEGYISMGFRTMNIGYTGDTKLDLYSFDMMCNKTTATIKFSEVTIISSLLPLPAEWIIEKGVKLTRGKALNFDGDGVYC